MENNTKVTYTVVAILVIILGAIAYFLQGNLSLPEVQGSGQVKSIKAALPTKGEVMPLKSAQLTKSNPTTTSTQVPEKITSATMTTNKGVIQITFATNTPETVANFAKLATEGFYNGTRFHRVIRDFMIQGGDPLSKNAANKDRWGQGGPGYSFKDEFHADDQFTQGTLAMANSGPNTNGSQFFIVTAIGGTPWLVGEHTVFGHITKGLDIALGIGGMQTDGADRPIQDVIIQKIEVK